MGLFDKLKNMLNKKEEKEESEVLETYERGLEKTREEFVSKLSLNNY